MNYYFAQLLLNSKAHCCVRVPVEFPAGFFHAANEKVSEKPGKVHEDLFCLELVKLCGCSGVHSEDVYGNVCVVVLVLSAIHSCILLFWFQGQSRHNLL